VTIERVCNLASSLIAASVELEPERALKLAVRIILVAEAVGWEKSWELMVGKQDHEAS
jgi:hypothetical protein